MFATLFMRPSGITSMQHSSSNIVTMLKGFNSNPQFHFIVLQICSWVSTPFSWVVQAVHAHLWHTSGAGKYAAGGHDQRLGAFLSTLLEWA